MEVTTRLGRGVLYTSVLVTFLLTGCGGQKKVTILRDAYNHPRIKVDNAGGETDSLLYEAQAKVEAEDRLVQMDLLRRLGNGSLAEIFGEKAAAQDRMALSVGFKQAARESWKVIQANYPQVKNMLEAYARGVNNYLSEIGNKPSVVRGLYQQWTHDKNFSFSDPKKFAPWSEVDSLVIAAGITFRLSSSLEEKAMMGKVAMTLIGVPPDLSKIDKFVKLFDYRPIENTFILGDRRGPLVAKKNKATSLEESVVPRKLPAKAVFFGAVLEDYGYPFTGPMRKSPSGSNSWVISRKAAGGRQAFMANDPHLPLTFPTSLYEMALQDARGVNLVGMPGILIGHNKRIAWSLTNQPADVDDLYLEDLNAAGTQVMHNGKWKNLRVVDEILRVRQDDGSVKQTTLKIRWVPHHGPILSDHIVPFKEVVSKIPKELFENPAISYRWTGHEATTELVAFYLLNRAKNFSEFKTALSYMKVGMQNVVYADVDGNIGYYSHANVPYRSYLTPWPVNVPVLGSGEMDWDSDSTGKTKWRTTFPEAYNPTSGFIVTANNDPLGYTLNRDLSQDYWGSTWDAGSRAQRITEMIQAKLGRIALTDVEDMQYDHKDLLGLKFIKFLKEQVPATINPSREYQEARSALINWDGLVTRDKREPVISEMWQRAMAAEHFKELVSASGEVDVLSNLTGATLTAKTLYHTLNDSFNSREKVKMDASVSLMSVALANATKKLPSREMRWGQYNLFKFYNAFKDFLPSPVFPTIERDGTWTTVDASGRKDDTGEQQGPNLRLVMTLEEGRPISGVNSLPGGNYDALVSDKWIEELDMWQAGKRRELVPFVD